jgi:hypothetical protein
MKKVLSIGVALVLGGCALDAQQQDGTPPDPAPSDDATQSTGGIVAEPPLPVDSLRSVSPKEIDPGQVLSYPASKVLDISTTRYIVEPEGNTRKDDAGHTYTDNNYWNFCGPGAEAVVLYYSPWRSNPKYGTVNTYYKEQYGPHVSNTFWTSPSNDATYGYKTVWRPSIMYLAEYSKPPNFSSPGVDDFSTYPTKGSKTSDVCDSLNWEASDHTKASSYCGSGSYWYVEVSGASSFHSHVVSDVNTTHDGQTGWALWAAVNTYKDSSHRLPNWSKSVIHAIAVVGYDDSAGTYTYIDTCGEHCNGSSGNQKVARNFTVSQSELHSIMVNHIW